MYVYSFVLTSPCVQC